MKTVDSPHGGTINAIRAAFGYIEPKHTGDIPKSQVIEWMKHPVLEVQGALYSKIIKEECAARIKPALEFQDYYDFVIPHLERCIKEDPDDEWSQSRYLAGHALAAWINDFWDKRVPRKFLTNIKERLGRLYVQGDEGVRDALINGLLEHLFERKDLAAFFKDWLNNPDLAPAYRDAMAWTESKP